MIRLLHLSDIHFSKRSGTHYDLDEHVRNLILTDLKEQVVNGPLTGCLVTGDIAFSGQEKEYEKALEFFASLSSELNFQEGAFWVVPGNHDYDRKAALDSIIVSELIEKFRKIDENEINDHIQKYSTSVEHKAKLYSPLNAFNNFAKKFGCSISPDLSFWDNRISLSESPELFLYIRGLNSALISSSQDDKKNDNTRMVMSLRQCQHKKVEDGLVMTLCHHPMSWLRNGEVLETELCNNAHIQLYGHQHENRIREIDKSVIIHAGAVHPERPHAGASIPSYNILEFSVEQETKSTVIALKVISRAYDFNEGIFKNIETKNGLNHKFKYEIKTKVSSLSTATEVLGLKSHSKEFVTSKINEELSLRTMLRKFYDLNVVQQFQILNELGLIREEDSEAIEKKNFMPFFFRAKDEKLLERMRDCIEAKHSVNQEINH